MTLTVEGRTQSLSPLCRTCGSPLFSTIVGPRCPIHGAAGSR